MYELAIDLIAKEREALSRRYRKIFNNQKHKFEQHELQTQISDYDKAIELLKSQQG